MFHVYVIQSVESGRYYKGVTTDLERRLAQHNAGNVRSTKAFSPWMLLYSEAFETHDEARKRERYLKGAAGRRFLKKVMHHP